MYEKIKKALIMPLINGGRVTLKIIFQLACRVKGGA